MSMVINTNIMSINAQNNLRTSQNDMSTAMERLSSGKRVNSAADDAAGLAIINRFTSQERGLNIAIRNANDGISMIQTAEGALDETTNILQRMRELAIQSANGIYSDANRATLNAEVNQLKAELTRIAETTSFNGLKILDGSLGDLELQVGAEAGERITVNLGTGFDAESLGTSETALSSGEFTLAEETGSSLKYATGSGTSLDAGDLVINDVDIPGFSSGSDTASTTDVGRSALAIADAINSVSEQTGVVAEAGKTTTTLSVALSAATSTQTITLATGDFVINDVSITGAAADADADDLVGWINAKSDQTGVTASLASGELTFTAVDGRNIEFDFDAGIASATGATFTLDGLTDDVNLITGGTDFSVSGSVTLRSNEEFTIGGNNPSDAGFSEGSVNLDVTALQDVAGSVGNSYAGTFTTLSNGDLAINGYNVDFSGVTLSASNEQSRILQYDSAMYISEAINSTDGLKSEVVATATTVANLGTISANTSKLLDLTVNGVTVSFGQNIETGDSNGYLVGALNNAFAGEAANSDAEGLVASLNDAGELIITADDGRNIDVAVATASTSGGVLSNIDTTSTSTFVVAKGTVSLAAKEGYALGEIGGDRRSLAGIDTSSQGSIATIDISTQSGAQDALAVVDRALDYLADARGDLGAASNRLEFTINNLSSVVENASAARSRVQDADFAAESAALARAQVLQQAGTAMLAQANAAPQSVLSLLQ